MKNNQTTTEAKIEQILDSVMVDAHAMAWNHSNITPEMRKAEYSEYIDELMQLIAKEKKAVLEACTCRKDKDEES